MSTNLGVWIAAIATLSMYSYLYKDNPFFKIGEHIFIAIAAGHTVVMGWQTIRGTAVTPMLQKGEYMWLVPLLGGLLLYTRFFKGIGWISRFPLGFLMGVGAAITLRGQLESSFIRQITGTMVPLNSLDNVVMVVGSVATLVYFFFSVQSQRGGIAQIAVLGRWTMMIAFGAAYGNTVMARMSLLIGRMQFLFGTWIKLIQ